MLQNLIVERFRLTMHWEARAEQGYALMAAKSGSKLVQTTAPENSEHRRTVTTSGHLTWQASTLEDLAEGLAGMMGTTVIDATGIHGRYDVSLDVAPDSLP